MGILCITRKPGEAFTLSAEGVAPIRLHLDANGDIAAGHGALGDRPELYVGQHADERARLSRRLRSAGCRPAAAR